MQITSEIDYAVRAMVYLKNHKGAPSLLGEISRATLIPPAFLSKILQKMVRRGFVRSKKGKKGGFALGKAPEKISVYDISMAACGGGALLRLMCDKNSEPCRLSKTCKIHGVWEDLGNIMAMILRSHKLSQF